MKQKIMEAVKQFFIENKPEIINNSIIIDFNEVAVRSFDVADEILDNFEEAVEYFNIQSEMYQMEKYPIKFINIPKSENIDIWKIRACDIGKFVVIKGFIRKTTEIFHVPTVIKYECYSCGNQINVVQVDEKIKRPFQCKCGYKGFKELNRISKDIQKLIVEEDIQTIDPTQKPRKILVTLENGLCHEKIDKEVQPGRKVMITGVIKEKSKKEKSVEQIKYLLANNIEIIDDTMSNIKLSKEDQNEIIEFSKKENFKQELLNKIYGTIHGHEKIKEAMLLQLVGADHLYYDGKLEERGTVNILLVSSPGSAKTKFLKCSMRYMPNSKFTTGTGSSGVGLIATVTKDEEMSGWSLESGVIPMAERSICCINENQEMCTNNGFKKIKEIKTGDFLFSWNKDIGLHKNEVKRVIDNGFKETICIKTYNGAEIKCTRDHKILTSKGWVQAGDINTNDYIKIPFKELNNKISNQEEFDLGFLQGFMVCDMYFKVPSFSASIKHSDRTEYIINLINKLCDNPNIIENKKNSLDVNINDKIRHFKPSCGYSVSGHKIKEILKEAENCSHTLSNDYILGYLSGILNTDTCISHKKGKNGIKTEIIITLSRKATNMHKIMNYIRDLFCQCGILCYKRENRLIISSLSSYNKCVDIFKDFIITKEKRDKFYTVDYKTRISSHDCRLDNSVVDWFKKIKFNTSKTIELGVHSSIWSACQNNTVTTLLLDKLKKIWTEITKEKFINHNKDYLLNKVENIEYYNKDRVYDLTMSIDSPNFIISGGLVHNCIDELDKMTPEDMGKLNNAMSDLMVPIDKANVHATISCDTSICATANPKDRVFDTYDKIWKQIKFPKDFLDRFDLVIPMDTIKTEEHQRKIVNVIFGKYKIDDEEEIKSNLDKDFVVKYISYARNHIKPVMTREAQKEIEDRYIALTKPSEIDEQAYMSTRLLTNIIRLANASAKQRLSSKIEKCDAEVAIDLVIYSLQKQEIIKSDINGYKIDINKIENIVPKKNRDLMNVIIGIIKEIRDEKTKVAEYDKILSGFKIMTTLAEGELVECLDKLRQRGDIIQPRYNQYKIME